MPTVKAQELCRDTAYLQLSRTGLRRQNRTATLEKNLTTFYKVKLLITWPRVLQVLTKSNENHVPSVTSKSAKALLLTAPNGREHKCPLADGLSHYAICVTGYYSVIRWNELVCTRTWKKGKCILPSRGSHTEKATQVVLWPHLHGIRKAIATEADQWLPGAGRVKGLVKAIRECFRVIKLLCTILLAHLSKH